jgi:hypothetical protein
VLDTLHMRESVPSLCVEIYHFPHPKAVGDLAVCSPMLGSIFPGPERAIHVVVQCKDVERISRRP